MTHHTHARQHGSHQTDAVVVEERQFTAESVQPETGAPQRDEASRGDGRASQSPNRVQFRVRVQHPNLLVLGDGSTPEIDLLVFAGIFPCMVIREIR